MVGTTDIHTNDNQIDQSRLKDFPFFYSLKKKYITYKRMTFLGMIIVYLFLLYRVLTVELSLPLTVLTIGIATLGVGICTVSVLYILFMFFGRSQLFMVSLLNTEFSMDMLKPSIVAKIDECLEEEAVSLNHIANYDVVSAVISSNTYKEHITKLIHGAEFTSPSMVSVKSSIGTFYALTIPLTHLNEVSMVNVYYKKDFPYHLQEVLVGDDDAIIFMELF